MSGPGVRRALARVTEILHGLVPISERALPLDVIGMRFEAQPSLIDGLVGRTRVAELVLLPLVDDGQVSATPHRRLSLEIRIRYDAPGPPEESGAQAVTALEDMDTVLEGLRQPAHWQGETSGIAGLHAVREARAVAPITPEGREQPTAFAVVLPYHLIYREEPA